MKKVIIIILVLTAMILLSADGRADQRGRYISWAVEEYNSYSWRELPGRRTGGGEKNHSELEDKWWRYPCCTPEREEELRRDRKNNTYAMRGGLYSDSTHRISPTQGRKYRIKLKNNTSCRMSVTAGIDGLNSLDSDRIRGRSTDAGWVLGGNTYMYLEGFQDGRSTAREFYWTSPYDAHSYIEDEFGRISIYVYFEEGECAEDLLMERCPRGRTSARHGGGGSSLPLATGAGKEIYNPVRSVNFNDLTQDPLEKITIIYSEQKRSRNDNNWNKEKKKTKSKSRTNKDNHNRNNRDEDHHRSTYSARSSSECYVGMGVRIVNSNSGGAEVTEVAEGGPAWRAGFQPGDQIIEAGGEYINDTRDLVHIVKDRPSANSVYIKFIRNHIYITSWIYPDYVCW